MSGVNRSRHSLWVIVVGDDHCAEPPATSAGEQGALPVQYRSQAGKRTAFQEALLRARRIAPASQLLVTADEAWRDIWEPAIWFIRPRHRFVSCDPAASWLTTAAAVVSIAHRAPDSIVTLLPARCQVRHEWILEAAMVRAISMLPRVPEAVVSLGMQETDCDSEEDYLVPERSQSGLLAPLLGVSRQPPSRIAHHLRAEGALIASRIVCAYASTLALHVSQVWPGLGSALLKRTLGDASPRNESETRTSVPDGLPPIMVRARQWYPPTLPQRALRVRACGWSGLRTVRATARWSQNPDTRTQDLPPDSNVRPAQL